MLFPNKSIYLYILSLSSILTFVYHSTVYSQVSDTASTSVSKFYWQPTYSRAPLIADSAKLNLNFIAPKAKRGAPRFYDLRKVLPANPLFIDYRESSYFQPQIVHDKMAQIMRRPSPDSFLPLPTIALLAASVALQYVDISKKIEISATDYLVEDKYLEILTSLWNQSPQTASMLFEKDNIRAGRTMISLEQQLNFLQDSKLIKVKKMEDAPSEYFAAQSKLMVIRLLKNASENQLLTMEQRISIGKLVLILEAG